MFEVFVFGLTNKENIPIFIPQFAKIVIQRTPNIIKIIKNIFPFLWQGECKYMHALLGLYILLL